MAASRRLIEDFLAEKRLAVIGVSRNPRHFSRRLFAELLRRGYDAVPVNPKAEQIEGLPCYPQVGQIQPPPAAALLMTPARASAQAVEECAQAGIRKVWLYRAVGRGAVSPAAAALCEARGMEAVVGLCPYMFLPGSSPVHRIHGWILKLGGSYPGP